MDRRAARLVRSLLAICLPLLCATRAVAQKSPTQDVPSQFKGDIETAARLRPQLMAQSSAASEHHVTGALVFDRLVEQVLVASHDKFAWQLRIVDDDNLNAYSLPDGSIYVEGGLARLAGTSAGLWAAILSHEISHVVHRDGARRYLCQKYLENGGGSAVVLGDPSLPSPSWADSEKASADLGRFCREMELDADREGLILMARAGYHPDFVPALHHLLHARSSVRTKGSPYAMHPCWEERDHELSHAYVATSIEFERRWPEWYASPGGNPPVIVFAEQPTVKKSGSKEWQIQVPLRCQNLAGAVEVVLRADTQHGKTIRPASLSNPAKSGDEIRQLTGCTSPKTTVTFVIADTAAPQKSLAPWTDVYVLDSWGTVLARADVPK
jgi:hypothetical protein